MDKRDLAILNCNEYLRENIGRYIEAFVSFYGENKRQEIQDKFSKAIFIGYQEPSNNEAFIHEVQKKYTERYLKEELKQNNMEDLYDKFFKNISFEHGSNFMENLKEYYRLHMLGEDGRKQDFIESGYNYFKNIKSDITMEDYMVYYNRGEIPEEYLEGKPWYIHNNVSYYIDKENINEKYESTRKRVLSDNENGLTEEEKMNFEGSLKFKQYLEILKCYENAYEKFLKIKQELKPHEEYIEKTKQFERMLENKTYKEYVQYIMDNYNFFKEDEMKEINEYLNSRSGLAPEYLKIISNSLIGEPLLKSFSKESQQIIEEKGKDYWKSKSIIKDRIDFFKLKGIDLGDNYDLYMNSKEAKSICPNYSTVSEVLKLKDEALNKFNNEFYSNTEKHRLIREEIKSKNLVSKEDSFNASIYTQNATCVNPNIVKTENGVDLFSLVIINVNSYDDCIDHFIVHELNHLYELSLTNYTDSKIEYICGWDYLTDDLNKEIEVDTINEDKEKRNYELFNEIINELIAQDISKKMVEENNFVFDEEGKAEYIGRTSYERTKVLVKQFYDEFRQEIIESRSNGNIEVILNRVGKENFEELNRLFEVFNEHFSGMNFYSIREDINNKKETEETKLYFEIINKTEEILENMKNYSNNMIR